MLTKKKTKPKKSEVKPLPQKAGAELAEHRPSDQRMLAKGLHRVVITRPAEARRRSPPTPHPAKREKRGRGLDAGNGPAEPRPKHAWPTAKPKAPPPPPPQLKLRKDRAPLEAGKTPQATRGRLSPLRPLGGQHP